jgi:hypothetical protein
MAGKKGDIRKERAGEKKQRDRPEHGRKKEEHGPETDRTETEKERENRKTGERDPTTQAKERLDAAKAIGGRTGGGTAERAESE